jgi:hypothetical protein
VVYAYAIAEPRHAAPTRTGLDGAPIRVVVAGDLMAIVSDCSGREVVASEDALWIHESVVEQLMGEGTVLPMRFGTVLPDDTEVRAMLVADRHELLDALDRVRDAVEVAVHVTWHSNGSGSSDVGYLVDRLARTRRAMEFAERMDAALVGLARASRRQVTTTPALLLTCAYLVDRARLEGFRDRIESLGFALDGATVVCTGPWPPYSFAVAEEQDAD